MMIKPTIAQSKTADGNLAQPLLEEAFVF